ncbi:MAG: 4-hydroxythreonine-4-phosphate dehydrogenase PdxA [Alphaproteobacteria bacterium]|nr:4-hydroxythreonine-4-phosphate dehydrogenase PdxA [Alphaproteobacteria bacterium]
MRPMIVTMGEPAGIGGEITLKAWQTLRTRQDRVFCVIADTAWLRTMNTDVPVRAIEHPAEAQEIFPQALPVINLTLTEQVVPGVPNPAHAKTVCESIERAVAYVQKKDACAVVTNPIHKTLLGQAGQHFPGHTEYLAHLCGGRHAPIMMLAGGGLRVVPLTIHIPLKNVAGQVTRDMIVTKTRLTAHAMKVQMGIEYPRLAMAGLNPHAGENGMIGTEEQEIIIPAIRQLQEQGLNVTGPHSADTMFHAEARASYDVAVCLYHDQALIPLKTLDFYGGVNMTLGLPIIRTSPDHGTAFDIAGTGQARSESLIAALHQAAQMALRQA